jgi:activator of 2-hydroxyglutaryl-CoA dehydratase
MAGLGLMLEVMAGRLDMTIDEMSATKVGKAIVNDGCPVFAELDALELLNQGVPKADIAGAVTESVAVRLNAILNDKAGVSNEATVFIGGLTKNKAVMDAVKKRSGVDFIIPKDAEYGAALGAALIAADQPVLE